MQLIDPQMEFWHVSSSTSSVYLFCIAVICFQCCCGQFGPPPPPPGGPPIGGPPIGIGGGPPPPGSPGNEFNQQDLLPQRRCYRCANCNGNYYNNYEYLEPYRVLCAPGVNQCIKLEGPRGNVERYCGNAGDISIQEGCRGLSGGVTLCACSRGDYCNSSTSIGEINLAKLLFFILVSCLSFAALRFR